MKNKYLIELINKGNKAIINNDFKMAEYYLLQAQKIDKNLADIYLKKLPVNKKLVNARK